MLRFSLSRNKRNTSKKNEHRPRKRQPEASRILGHTSGDKPNTSRSAAKKSFWANMDWSRARINVVVIGFCLIWGGLWCRAWYLQMIMGPRLADRANRQHTATELVTGRRGMIFDRNGQVLARSVEARSVYAKPREIQDFLSMANTLGPILGLEPQKLYDELSKTSRRFVWLRRKVDDYTAEAVRRANIPGIGLTKEYDRVYPFKHLAGQLLGFVGLDDKGLEGIERSLDSRLGSLPTRQVVQRDATGRRFYLHEEGRSEPRGEDITLTIDVQMQFIAEEAVARAARDFDAKWSGALVVDVPSGDILAWAQYPFFNPNNYRESSPVVYRNRLAADALEPGSTFKPFIMAAALEEKKIATTTPIDCENGRWETKKFTIRDTSRQGVLPAHKVLRYSSNIGMAKIGLELGAATTYRYLRALGFGEHAVVPVADSRGILRIPRDWSDVDIMSAAFGQSVSVTGLQMAQAYLTLLNDGVYKPLRLLREDGNVEERHPRIFRAAVVEQVCKMMRDVVEEKDGTGKRARIEGVEVAGKTGTAQKADRRAGSYGNKRLASFVGFLPADDPRYLIVVLVDEPTKNQYGGVVAAPVFREIAARSITYSGAIVPTAEAEEKEEKKKTNRQRGLKLALPEAPYLAEAVVTPARHVTDGMQLPGHRSRASTKVPDVRGKSLRNAVELFARAGVVPELKGNGTKVVKQSPPAGSDWAEEGKNVRYILWLSEK